jgi:hypothetical protein
MVRKGDRAVAFQNAQRRGAERGKGRGADVCGRVAEGGGGGGAGVAVSSAGRPAMTPSRRTRVAMLSRK